MGMVSNSNTTPTSPMNKRKGCVIDSLLEAKRSNNLQEMKRELSVLINKKAEFLRAQKRSSLFVDARNINDPSVMDEFCAFYKKITSSNFLEEEAESHLDLVKETVKESIIIEWPRSFPATLPSSPESEIDFAPLIHRARNVVKCRTSHPTMRVKVCAISNQNEQPCPQVVEAFFRASLVKLASDTNDSKYRQLAGKMILTQREGIPVTKTQEQSGAIVSPEGKLIAAQAAKEVVIPSLPDLLNEPNVRSTLLKFENNMLCATFPEMGVTLNSMIDRRQLATRYAIQIEVVLNIENKLTVSHVLLSHPFLIAITNDQTEPLLQSIFWNRLVNTDHIEPCESFSELSIVNWGTLKQAVRAIAKTQMPNCRFLTNYEINHIQCMILLPRVIDCCTREQHQAIEFGLFGDMLTSSSGNVNEIGKLLRNRLLNESVMDTCQIEKKEFMVERSISILDMNTELSHSPWMWLYRAVEMIQDVGHKLCPTPVVEKKTTKTKKQMAAAEDYQTIVSLFNKGFITFCSTQKCGSAFENLEKSSSTMLLRFCDENAAHFSFCYGLVSGKPKIGSISAEQIKDFKQGLPEVLIDEHFPSRYSYISKLSLNENDSDDIVLKRDVFHNYKTQRRKMDSVAILDNETNRVDVLSGAQMARQSPPPQPTSSTSAAFPFSILPTDIVTNFNNFQSLLTSNDVDLTTLMAVFASSIQNSTESGKNENELITVKTEELEMNDIDEDPTNHIAQLLMKQNQGN